MGRAGSGGSHHSSSHSHSHSSSSHRTSSHRPSSHSSGSRAGSGSHTSFSNSGGGGYHSSRLYHYHSGGYGYRTTASPITTILVFIIVIAISLAASYLNTVKGTPKSTIVRTKLTGSVWESDCIVDELGWFDNTRKASNYLKDFYDETGIQPMIYLREYDSSLSSDDEKEDWADTYFEEQGLEPNAMLFVYFAEYDTDNDVGLMTVSYGAEAGSLMDAEAEDIFWHYIDRYWYTDKSTDDVFRLAFSDTANAIMHVSKTGVDIVYLVLSGIVVIAVIALVTAFILKKKKLKVEQTQADAAILNSNVRRIDTSSDLEDQYLR